MVSDGWHVDSAGVNAVTASMGQHGTAFADAVLPIPGSITAAAECSDSGLITDALDAFMGIVGGQLKMVERELPAAVHGLVQAAQAIEAGDREIADGIERSAAAGFR